MAKKILESGSADHENSHLGICERSIQTEGKKVKIKPATLNVWYE